MWFFRILGELREAAWRYVPRRDCISPEHLEAINRAEGTRGVDLPTWRSPREIAAMRWQERVARSHERVA